MKINNLTEEEIPADLDGNAKKYRDELIEKVAEFDDETLKNILKGQELPKLILKGQSEKVLYQVNSSQYLVETIELQKSNFFLMVLLNILPSPLDLPAS